MNADAIHIHQGSSLRLGPGEKNHLVKVFNSQGISLECIDFSQDIVNFPQAYVGYINLPERRIIIDPKHDGVDLRHIIRIYYFLYASDSTDLDDPIYDIDFGSTFDVMENFVKELDIVIKKGLPVEYKNSRESLQYLRGNVNIVNTLMNKKLGKREIFDCYFDELSNDVPINQVFYKALLKASRIVDIGITSILKKHFMDVSEIYNVPNVNLNTNTMYCKKALTLAYMILNDMSISDYGNQAYGQNLLLNFDRLFEEFIKRVLTVYSGDYGFTYWDDEKTYALCRTQSDEFYKSYIPDMLYGYQDKEHPNSAYAILDMKNKTSKPFSNADVYQMFFYANQLHSKKVILCYPASESKGNATLRFGNESFLLHKLYAAYINIAGNTSKEFKKNIYDFTENIRSLL